MARENDNRLFYTCSLIEYLGRDRKRTRREVTDCLGKDAIERIYDYADVFHCEPIQKVADDFCDQCNITEGVFDNVAECRYKIPDYWDIGEVYERLIEDCFEEKEVIQGIWKVYHSWIDDMISDFNTDFYYQPRDYIAACYRMGEILE
ncbi:MAG: hypothetical protein LUF32_08685 [Clostridiales bacterium]|nr:hypothetical protein [Clostridiales bacterium]